MTPRITALVATVALLAAACTSDPISPLAPGAAQLAKGGGNGSGGGGGGTPTTPPTPILSVAGNWRGAYPRPNAAPGDSSIWSLNLTQNGDRLEGGLMFISIVNGRISSLGVSAIRKGSVSGNVVSLEFPKGEGAETVTGFSGTVSDDGKTMLAFHSRYPEAVTLTR